MEVRSQNAEVRMRKAEDGSQKSEVRMLPARTFEDLAVWRKSYDFVLNLYRLTDSFPKSEIYGLTSQMRHPRQRPINEYGQGSVATLLLSNLEEVSRLLERTPRGILTSQF